MIWYATFTECVEKQSGHCNSGIISCLQAFKNQFKDDYRILRARKFRMQDAAERKIEIFYPKNLPQQWFAGLNGTNEVSFIPRFL